MSELFKPLTGTPLVASVAAATPAGPVATASAAFATLPPALADLTAGTVLAGVVVERTRGQVLLKTDKGMLQVQTNLPLKLGASVVLEVQSVGAQVRLAILSVDQHAPAVSGAESLALGTAPQTASERDTPAPASRPLTPPLIGRTMTATVVGPPDPRLAGETAEPTIPLLLRRLITISALARVAAESTPSTTNDAPSSPATTASLQGRAERGETAPLPTTDVTRKAVNSPSIEPLVIPSSEELEAALRMLPPPARDIVAALLDDGALETPIASQAARGTGTPTSSGTQPDGPRGHDVGSQNPTERASTTPNPKTIAIRIVAQSLAPSSTAPLRPHVATQSDAITLVGTAVAEDTTGTEIATPIGRLRLPIPGALPQGARITFEVLPRTADDRASPQSERAAAAILQATVETTREWSAARDVVARWPEAADMLLPKAGEPLGPALLAFIASVRGGGNLKAWLGSRLAAAADKSPDKKELIARLGQELAIQTRSAASTEADGWRTIAVPVIDAGRISELRFRFRKRERREGAEESGRRFVVQATLSALGPLQLDGTVRERRLDLVVRTARPLPAPMRRDIAELFARSLAATDYRGEIRFQNDALSDIMPGAAGHSSGVVV